MIIFGILVCMVAIGFFCWLLFTLAVFALPFFIGVTTGMWALNSGAGWLGAILVGALAAGFTFGAGQLLLGTVRPLWAKLAIALVFVAPAVVAGYHATHGIAKHLMPSEAWQIAFSIIGAVAVGIAAFLRTLEWQAPANPAGALLRLECAARPGGPNETTVSVSS